MPTKEICTREDSMIRARGLINGIDNSRAQTSRDPEFTDPEAQRIAEIAEQQGWNIAVHDYMRSVNHKAYRLGIDEYRSQIRFFLPLSFDARVLHLRSVILLNALEHLNSVNGSSWKTAQSSAT